MSNGTILSTVGSVIGYIAPQTGPAAAAELTTVTAGHVSDVGQATNVSINAIGTDIADSTILHGVANTVAAAGGMPVVSPMVAALVGPVLSGPLSDVASATQQPVTLLAPQTGPAASAVVMDIGHGNLAATGHGIGTAVTAAGTDINQSTILHGVANTLTSITDDGGSFHFPTAPHLGSGSLSGILGGASVGVHATSSLGASAMAAAAAHVDVHYDHPLDTLVHATHHA